ncbi:hypothetical protein SAMN05428942_7281 [Streptomyces sp. 2112.2]|nr:hypothetical protein SAMN05428942_7281 [Streptomyces sp. 2112.2]
MATTTQIRRQYPLAERPELVRLQGDACIVCGKRRGRRDDPLTPAGTVRTVAPSGDVIAWNVRVCPEHEGAAR